MNNKLAELYQQILLNEAESNLQNPSSDTVGALPKENVFGKKPDVKGTEGAKDAKVNSPKTLDIETDEEGDVDTDTAKEKDSGEPESVPSKSADAQYSGGKPRTVVGDSLGAFETLFKKTLFTETEGMEDDMNSEGDDEKAEEETKEEEEKELGELEAEEEEEADLLSDLKNLHTRITEIISKLEAAVEEEGPLGNEDHGYDEEDFDTEFGEEPAAEEEVKAESVKSQKLNTSKGRSLEKHTNNKVALKVKSGKAKTDVTEPTALKVAKDGKKGLQTIKNNKVSNKNVGDTYFQ